MCWGLVLGGGPAGEGSTCLSLSLCLSSWLQVGVLLTPAPHLHVQKSPVLKCCGVPRPPTSACGRPVCNLFKCLWKLLIHSHTLPLRPDMLFWFVIPAFFQAPGLFPRVISVQGGVRKWHTGHSCLSRFLPSVFIFLFPYSDSIWMELNLESGGCFWRLFQAFQERWPTNLHLRT